MINLKSWNIKESIYSMLTGYIHEETDVQGEPLERGQTIKPFKI